MAVEKGTGILTLTPTHGSTIHLNVTSVEVSIFGSIVSVSPSAGLHAPLGDANFTLEAPSGTFLSKSGTPSEAISGVKFRTVPDIVVPLLVSSSPHAGEREVNTDRHIQLGFSEPVVASSIGGGVSLTTSGTGTSSEFRLVSQ